MVYAISNPQGDAALSKRNPRNVDGSLLIYSLLYILYSLHSVLSTLHDSIILSGFREFLLGERSDSLRVHFQANRKNKKVPCRSVLLRNIEASADNKSSVGFQIHKFQFLNKRVATCFPKHRHYALLSKL